MAFCRRQDPRCGRGRYRCEQRGLFSQSLDRRIGSADVAENVGYEFGLPLFEREVLSANNEKEEVGPLRRHIVKHGRLGHTRHEPLHRHENGDHRVHERLGERCCWRWHHRERGIAWSHEYSGNRTSIGRAKTRHLGTAGDQADGGTGGRYRLKRKRHGTTLPLRREAMKQIPLGQEVAAPAPDSEQSLTGPGLFLAEQAPRRSSCRVRRP